MSLISSPVGSQHSRWCPIAVPPGIGCVTATDQRHARMGLLDRFKKNKLVGKAADTVGDVADKVGGVVADGVEKATDFIDDKTGGKIHDQLEKVDNVASKLRSDDDSTDDDKDSDDDSTDDDKDSDA